MSLHSTGPIAGDILVVDDDINSLRALSELLAAQGYQVRRARDGSTALMIATADPPDLVLLDVTMPGMSGYDVCRELKTRPESKAVPVIFVSGLDEVVDKVRGFQVGGVDYITKPFRAEEIEARIKTHLSLFRMQVELDHRNAELQNRVTELSTINRIAQTVAATADLQDMLIYASQQVTALFANRITYIIVRDKKDTKLQILAGAERDSGSLSSTDLTLPLTDMPITRRTLDSGVSNFVTDLHSVPMPASVQALAKRFNLYSVLNVPLKIHGKTIGILTLGYDDPQCSLSKNEIALAETIAGDIAAAIENDRLTEQARSAAVSAERQRLARELHDSVTQSLYSLTLLSSGWKSMAEQGTLEDPVGAFEHLGDVGQQALREMRLLIHQLRPPTLEELGLMQALQQRLDAVELRAGIDSQILTDGDVDDLPHVLEDQLYYIAQESLNNSLRHAQATEVLIRINVEKDRVQQTIQDNGKGFDRDAATGGMGLTSMRERAESIGGSFEIASERNHGATVRVVIPLESVVKS